MSLLWKIEASLRRHDKCIQPFPDAWSSSLTYPESSLHCWTHEAVHQSTWRVRQLTNSCRRVFDASLVCSSTSSTAGWFVPKDSYTSEFMQHTIRLGHTCHPCICYSLLY